MKRNIQSKKVIIPKEAEEQEEEQKIVPMKKKAPAKVQQKNTVLVQNIAPLKPQIRRVQEYNPKINSPKNFSEENFEVKTKTTNQAVDMNEPIQVALKIALKPVSLNSTRSQEIPCLVEVSSPENNSTERSGIDIVCVIDVSGSMSGDKLELVKKTLLFMIKRLDVTDRVCLLTFSDDAKLLSGLVCTNEAGKVKLEDTVKRMRIEGGTEIIAGLELGLDVLSRRSVPNQVTSVILLTDGVDNNASTAMARFQQVYSKYSPKIPSGFVIHTFGYGSDHQADLLNSMADKTNGGFYYIEQESLIPKSFSDCLGEMMSVVADSVHVELTTQAGSIPYSLTKVYSETGDLSFRMPPILSGDKKESVFLINFLMSDAHVEPNHFEFPIKAKVTYKIVATGEVKQIEQVLQVHIVNESDNCEVALDEDVMINFYRAKCADVLKEASNFGDNNQMDNARNLLAAAIVEFQNCVVAESDVIKQLVNDFNSALPRFENRRVYEYGGKAELKSKMNCHQNKRGFYKNKMQSKLMTEAQEEFE